VLAFVSGNRCNQSRFEAHHVVHLGLQGKQDYKLMRLIRAQEFVFVTNNALDFERLYAKEEIHLGLIIILRSVPPYLQRTLFQEALDFIGKNEPVNSRIVVDWDGFEVTMTRYDRPPEENG
jgi:predicted nuclease of predicted toxin-antitoxin system